jgi:two-component system OmpR family response regulator
MQRVLLIDDDIELSNLLGDFIRLEGFAVIIENNPTNGLTLATSSQVDIVVLDVMMPKLDGIEFLRKIRAKSNLPIMLLTAKGDDDSRIVGLELGADDYVTKPCTPREIVARIRAILRRTSSKLVAETKAIKVGKLVIYPQQRLAEWDRQPIELTSTEFNLLEVLAKDAGKVVKKDDLSIRGLGRPLVKYDRSIDVHMSSIRQKLGGEESGNQFIQTIYRIGYQMINTNEV